MNATHLNSLTDSELIRHANAAGDALAGLLADRLGDTMPARELVDVLDYLDFYLDPEKLEARLVELGDKEDALEERTAELEAARADLAQAEADILELKAELDALAASAT